MFNIYKELPNKIISEIVISSSTINSNNKFSQKSHRKNNFKKIIKKN